MTVYTNVFEAIQKSNSVASPEVLPLQLLPHLSFCLCNCQSCYPLSLLVPVTSLRSLKCQPDIFSLTVPLTSNFGASTPHSHIGNGGDEHGPFRLKLPQDMVKAPSEVEVEALPDGWFCQAFPAHPHCMFGSARSNRPPFSRLGPIHHQVVIN